MNNKRNRVPITYKWMGFVLLFILCFILSMLFGAANTSFHDLWLAVTSTSKEENALLLREIRLPRELAAILIGAAFAVSGAIMQGVTRNPLADPGLLGLTSGANMALAVAFVFFPGLNNFAIMIACFFGAAVGAALVLLLGSTRGGRLSPIRIILAGAAVSGFLYAISDAVSLTFKISKDVSMWTAGGLIGTTWPQLQTIAPVIIVGIIAALILSNQVGILSLSDDVAIGLGQKLVVIKAILFIIVVVLTGASVALVGNMAFVGLMIPHIVRRFVGSDYRHILAFSALVGGTFMLLADTLGRTIHAHHETPVAAIVAMLGLPFFLFVVSKGGKTFS
ncbi:FecCD family ABC transporter permease [Paenibacillus radicis (ex Gao et al. 2016)]|uniref:Ferrichrome ABC transporter permease n=1 Tax=Paenibacillus radicis (ex Gao et al. 2016) TaxID=1737354 RepID=A0A917LS32_9BACL|nr:iron ABC transporter permease [Paenibacillus radicis (ex Gao et al. 2016)]GGG53675.1 ferrichrome ABC transporter permease [Paenibacillus radicis (ex Gao et al. 2016)]